MRLTCHGPKWPIALLSSIVVAALAASAAFSADAPAGTAVAGVPEALREARRHMLDATINTLTFRSMDSLFETREVTRSGPVWRLPRQDRELDFNYVVRGERHRADEFEERNRTNAMIILKHGRIVHEAYFNLTNERTRFISFSMAKSITATLLGIALAERKIRSLDDTVATYVPELANSAYGKVAIRQVMRMRSGIAFDERYDFGVHSQAQEVFENALVRNEQRFAYLAPTLKRRDGDPGSFNYSTMDTAVLGLVLEGAVGEPVSTYMTSKLWEPLGAEANGFWLADGPPGVGRSLSGMGYNAILRDYARLGEMMLRNGRAGARQIVSPDWVKLVTTSTAIEDGHGMVPAEFGYGYQWWTLHGMGTYFALGLQGQFIFVDPASETVIAKLSYWPPGDDRAFLDEAIEFFKAASAWSP